MLMFRLFHYTFLFVYIFIYLTCPLFNHKEIITLLIFLTMHTELG